MRALAISFVVFGVLSVQGAAAQRLYDPGLTLAALLDEGVAVNAVITSNAMHCEFTAQLLEAEAERALRRDGIVSRPDSSARLRIEVIMTSLPSRGCAAFVDVQLVVVVNPDRQAVMLAAVGGRLLTRTAPAHVGRIRETVEEDVSVIANALRRAQNSLPQR